jgi:hypothetical protein
MSNNNYKQVIINLATKIAEAADDADKFDRGQDAAGQRLRALFLELYKESKNHRQTIQDVRNERKQSSK